MAESIEVKAVMSGNCSNFTVYSNDLSEFSKDVNYAKTHSSDDPDFDKLTFISAKQKMRRGMWSVTDPIRQDLWKNLTNWLYKDVNVYHDAIKDLYKEGISAGVALPSIVDPDHILTYHLNAHGVTTVHVICSVIHFLNPDITSSPMLFPLASILLHYMEADLCFQCLEGMIKRRDRKYLPQTRIAMYCTSRIIDDLSKRYISFVVERLGDIFDHWIWWIFMDLPFPYLICIMDSYLLEGEKILYRVALTILKKYPKHYKKHDPSIPLPDQIRMFCREMPIPVARFMRSAFRIRRLSRRMIQKLLDKHESSALVMYRNQPLVQSAVYVDAVPGCFLSNTQLSKVISWCPTRLSLYQPELLFSCETHGVSLQTLYNQASLHGPTIIVIQTDKQEIFGAFCSCDWKDRKIYSYFGTGETFVFTLVPEETRYPWVGLNVENVEESREMFLSGGNTHLIVGGGGTGNAIHLDSLMEHCTSTTCETFSNPPLADVHPETGEFVCMNVQVLGFSKTRNLA